MEKIIIEVSLLGIFLLIAIVAFLKVCIWCNRPIFNKFNEVKHTVVQFKLNDQIMRGNVCEKRGGLLRPMEYQVLLINTSLIWIDARSLLVIQRHYSIY